MINENRYFSQSPGITDMVRTNRRRSRKAPSAPAVAIRQIDRKVLRNRFAPLEALDEEQLEFIHDQASPAKQGSESWQEAGGSNAGGALFQPASEEGEARCFMGSANPEDAGGRGRNGSSLLRVGPSG